MSINKAIICMGANTPDAIERLSEAYGVLASSGDIVRATPPYPTAPEYAGESEPYINQIVVINTGLSIDELVCKTKRYQTAIRADNPYSPLVNIDIDIVEWNGDIIRPADAKAAYYTQGKDLLENHP